MGGCANIDKTMYSGGRWLIPVSVEPLLKLKIDLVPLSTLASITVLFDSYFRVVWPTDILCLIVMLLCTIYKCK